jgi:hypothetical protein
MVEGMMIGDLNKLGLLWLRKLEEASPALAAQWRRDGSLLGRVLEAQRDAERTIAEMVSGGIPDSEALAAASEMHLIAPG